jgi:hypothetical protein
VTLKMRRDSSEANFKYFKPTWGDCVWTGIITTACWMTKLGRRSAPGTRINWHYFSNHWNLLALTTFGLVLSTCIAFPRAWYACADTSFVCQTNKPAAANATNTDNTSIGATGGMQSRDSLDSDLLRCWSAITNLKLSAALGIPCMYIYTLYYARGIDSFNFYTRMFFQIMSDMAAFIIIVAWLFFSFVIGIFPLHCQQVERSGCMRVLYVSH